MAEIHPSAIVSSEAKLGESVVVSPFAIIHGDVEIGDGTFIGPGVNIYDGARIGRNVKIYQNASIAHRPQDLKFANEETYLYIGDETVIHEFVTLHRGTKETGKTVIGSNVLLMAYSHVAHDCHIGNRCILANGVQIAGHVHIDDWTIIGGLTPVHQFCKVGSHVMIGGGFRAVQDVPPFILAAEEPLRYEGINIVGLRRRGFTAKDIEDIKKMYALIYDPHNNVTQAVDMIKEMFPGNQHAKLITDFIASSTRGLVGKKTGRERR